ncbi:VOC family protein [Phyllobacterium salinisoli]|uniref:VOC family protein n=1 Tax=Phyllobacterium salinisoli TaxID=1899321 RepID=A0A368K6Q1_9HYPH|nr:VOC family protein [Phyllobacterium salinisoli]RCS24894.1 VOC family protein [Phyllobacterium salinisoli]
MTRSVALVTIVVRDYDEAVAWYTEKLEFELVEDTALSGGKRWVVVSSAGATTRLLLAKADGVEQEAYIGNQTGGRVAFFLDTDDFSRDHSSMLEAGVHFLEEPRHEKYGTVAVFEDLYGNKWDLIEHRG